MFSRDFVSAYSLSLLLCIVSAASVGCGDNQPDGSPAVSNPTVSDPIVSELGTETPDSEAPVVNEAAELTQEFGPAPEGKVLRHAVFFKFRESTSEDEVQAVVDAFRGLPTKVEDIIDFAWGTNNSPEPLDDGYTHCFLLTFKDEAGRAAYLPHPAHKEFGSVLSGKNEQTFVIDYWGTPAASPPEKQLKHAVFFRFKKDAAADDVHKVEEAFAALPSKIEEIKDFEWGTNNSPEPKSDGFTHCFMVTFDSEEGRKVYLDHAEHLAFVEVLKPVLDAPRVLDFWAQK